MKIDRLILRLFGGLVLTVPLLANTVRIYVVNSAGRSVDVIDAATNSIVRQIRGLDAPLTVHFSPDGNRMYMTTYDADVLNVVDRKTGKYIKKVPLSGHGDDLAVTPDGKLVVVCIGNMAGSESVGALDFVDTNSLEKVKTIPIDRGLHDVAVTADSKYAVAGSSTRLSGNTATVFDLQTKQIAWVVNFDDGVQPVAIESNPDGSASRIFLQLGRLNGFVVVDFATHKEVARIELPDDPKPFPHAGPAASHGIEIAPDGKTFWINSNDANAVFVYSLPDLKLMGHISMPVLNPPGKAPLPAFPNWLTFTPDSKTAYITNSAIKSVSVVDAKNLKLLGVIPVGEVPKRISTLVLPGEESTPASPVASASPLPLDYEFFKMQVEPVFLKKRSEDHARCYACHEKFKHPKGFHLEPLSPGSNFWTEEQSRKNFQVLSQLVVPGKPLSGLFPFRPLAPEAGGDAVHIHGGGRQFESQDDPDWQTFANWVRGEKANSSSVQ